MSNRCALLVGTAEKGNCRQKSLSDFYAFLKSPSGGLWREDEILIAPDGMPSHMLGLLLHRLEENGTEFVLLYFCTAGGTVRNGGRETDCMSPYQITVYDACSCYVSDCEVNTVSAAAVHCTVKAPLIRTEWVRQIFSGRKSRIALYACSEKEIPAVDAEGCGIYTKALIHAFRTAGGTCSAKEAHFEASLAVGMATCARIKPQMTVRTTGISPAAHTAEALRA